MNRCELANSYHDQVYNCCQSIVAAFADKTGLDFATSVNVSEGFGGGAGSGELCGALSGAIMVLGLMNPVDPEDVVGSKRRVMKLSKELQNRFREQFEAVRCTDLLKNRNINAETATGPAKEMGLTNHCAIMIVTAVDIVEKLLEEQGA